MISGDITIRVRYAETDQMGLLHHANYLIYFEQGRTELLRDQGISYRDIEDQGFFLVLTNVAYCFDRTFDSLSSYHFESASFLRLQRMPVLRNALVPLPYPFLQGLDMMKYSDDMGITYGNIYLLGQLRMLARYHLHRR